MLVQIGPVSSESAVAWLDYADVVVETLRDLDHSGVDEAAIGSFANLLGEWRPIAEASDEFLWRSEETPERVEFLMHSLRRAGDAVEREANSSGADLLRPPEADEFHLRLVRDVLAALEAHGDGCASFALEMRATWGLDLGV